jgi:alpha-tubulin suppressor-like RCC1 family protein
MKNNTKYFLNELSVETGNYIVHYFFDPLNFSGNNYVYNNTPYTNYTGFYSGSNLTNNLNAQTGYLYFTGNSRIDISLPNFNTEQFTFIYSYEKTNNSPCVLFSNLNTGSNGKYYGFNVCVSNYNNILIEYYDTNNELKYLTTNYNLDTKGILSVRGYSNNIFVSYYNAAFDNFYTESFEIDNNITPNVTGSIVLGSGKFSNFPNYSGYVKDFILIDQNITDFQLNNVIDQFVYNLSSYYTLSLDNEFYGYTNYPENITHIFNSYSGITGCFNNQFLDNTGVIYGSITGSNYSLDLTGASGLTTNLSNSNNFSLLKDNVKKVEIFSTSTAASKTVIALLNNGRITGWGDNFNNQLYGGLNYVGDWTGSLVGKLTDIIDIKCNNNACLALSSNGTVTGWGSNNKGKIYGTIEYNNINNYFTGLYEDAPLAQLDNIMQIDLGFFNDFSVFLKNNGTLISWGENLNGTVAGINDRILGYPLKLNITGIYEDYIYLSGLTLDYTGNYNSKPAYKYINDLENFGLSLYNDTTGWILDYSGLSDIINLTGNTYAPQVTNNLNLPYQIIVENSIDTGINVLYTYNSTSGYINNTNNWRIFRSGTNWIAYSGITGYENGGGNASVLPLTNWSGVEENEFYGDITIKPKYIQLEYIYNTDLNNIFTGTFEDSIVGKLTGITKTSAGSVHVYALKNDGTITGWGNNAVYQIDPYNVSTVWSGNWNNNQLNLLTGVKDIVAGSTHGLVLFNDNTISGWGNISNFPNSGNYLTGVNQIGGGSSYLTALLNNEILTGWGNNSSTGFRPTGIINNVKKYNSSFFGTYYENITGQQVKNLVSGNAYFVYNIEVERPTIVTETTTVIVSQISGFENQVLFSGVTGYNTGWYKDIPQFCGTGFPLYLVSGIIGVITGDVLTGIDIITSSSTSQVLVLSNETYQTGFSSGIYDPSKTGNYVYDFSYVNDGSQVNMLDIIYLDTGYHTLQSKNVFIKEDGYIANKTTNLNYLKNYTLGKNLDYLNSLGVDLLLINQLIDNDDILEIYLFKINSGLDINLNNSLLLSKASKNFRFANTGANYSVNVNGVGQISGFDYLLTGTLGSPLAAYDFFDYIEGDFVKTGEAIFTYTGETGRILNKKDFLYLNGQKLISGYHYNFNTPNIEYITGNIPVTGIVHAFNVLIEYDRYTGSMYSFDLPRFSKNSELIWLNGIKLKSDSYYEISENDQFYNPTFYDKTDVIIYNNTDNYFNE